MKVNITQRGGDTDCIDIFPEACRYFSDMLMSKRLSNSLNINIKLQATTLKKDTLG